MATLVQVGPYEYIGWVQTREKFINVMTTTNVPGRTPPEPLATLVDGVLVPCWGLQIDEIGPITTLDPTSRPENPKPPLKFVDGVHVNFRIYAQDIKDYLDAYMQSQPIDRSGQGVPDGPMGSKGLKLYPWINNPQLKTRRRVWA